MSATKPSVTFAIEQLKNFNGTTSISGPCGVGIAIESAFGRNPNNDSGSDTVTHEVKTTRGKCDVTLFTKTPEYGDTYRIVEEYGYVDDYGRQTYMKDIKYNSPDLFFAADM